MRSKRFSTTLTLEFALLQEHILIQNERMTKLYVIQSENDPLLWFGVLFVDSGLYKGSILRFRLVIDESFPNCGCPQVFFDLAPLHPLIDPEDGKLDTRNAFPDWNSNTHRLSKLLLFVKRAFYQAEAYIKQIQELIMQHTSVAGETGTNVTFDSDLVNTFQNFQRTYEFIRIYTEDFENLKLKIEAFKEMCLDKLYESPEADRNAIVFRPWEPEIHETIRKSVLSGRFCPPNSLASYNKETDSVLFMPDSDET